MVTPIDVNALINSLLPLLVSVMIIQMMISIVKELRTAV